MNDQAGDQAHRSIKRLTVAVWVLFIIAILNTFLLIYVVMIPSYIGQGIATSLSETTMPEEIRSELQYSGFHKWPLEKQISQASLILLTKNQQERNRLTPVVSEILKQSPNTVFYYKVGDRISKKSRVVEANTSYGDGEVMFFTGSPASFKQSTSYRSDRITGFGDMPIELFRKKIQEQN